FFVILPRQIFDMDNVISNIITQAKPFIKEQERDIPLIEKAYDFCKSHLSDAELENILSQAEIAISLIGLGAKALMSIFLKPCHEKGKITNAEISSAYGEKVLGIIVGLEKVEKINTTRSKLQSENFIKLILSQADDVRVVLILLSSKLNKLRNIKNLSEEEQKNLAEELESLYAPLAHRLGLYQIKTEMEEMSMKYLHNDIYKTIAKQLAEKKAARDRYIESFIQPLKELLESKGIPPFEIKGRPKSIHSIWNKLQKGKVTFDHIYDLFAIRIIIDSQPEFEKRDCWNVYSIISDLYRPNPNRLRDWISSPKSSGYESLHTTVLGPENRWVEVQIRTKRMDEVAEKGQAAHWIYKDGESASNSIHWLSSIREMLESKDESLENDNNSRMELYTSEVFIFTPQGDLRKLPADATLLDFAYEIHSNIGNTCTGGKVNGKIVTINHILKNGDSVEVFTSKNQFPKQDWLSFVKTSKARTHIKKYLKDLQYKTANIGKETLSRKFTQINIKFSDENIRKVTKHFGFKEPFDLYMAVMANKVDTSQIKSVFEEKTEDKKPLSINADEFKEKFNRRIAKDSENLLIIDNINDNLDYKLAKCCNPIKGDDIFGFVSAGGGIKIHRLNCPNALNMMGQYPYRIIKAQWSRAEANVDFVTGIRITGSDEISIINNITELLAKDTLVKLRGIKLDSKDGNFEGMLTLSIKDIVHLDKILEKVRSIKGVFSAERFDVRN
ncbi:MAG: bifunctional (p)ppGpp synthetase/guanosine-3',5'-bis(diphosphate) 3'-pyrophosphohydrolase, partial [Bacteroidales bacterium]|nr:bifunctional (p)ppGpp synthetase/guanosine-3',5'-bis(diphosphate) 3'-pyrophosphohydrolase [Bacteroidales bacterium]